MLLACLLGLGLAAFAQENLIVNPDFEEMQPGTGLRIGSRVKGWGEVAAGEIGYVHSQLPGCKPMQNPYGKQQPHSGNGYVFMKAFGQKRGDFGDINRYYLQTRLTRPLKAGERFRLSFWFSFAENSTVAIEHLSALLFNAPIQKMGDAPRTLYRPQDSSTGGDLALVKIRALQTLHSPHGIVDDTGQWLEVAADLVAQGGEEWLVIGCFEPPHRTPHKLLPKKSFNWWDNYLFVDDVYLQVQADSVPAPQATDTLLTVSRMKNQLERTGEVALGDVLFAHNSPALAPAARPMLDTLATVLRQWPQWRVSIEGHTDNAGDSLYNIRLSLRRAQAVAAYLAQNGIATSRMQVQGWGASRPLLPNTSTRNRRRNRRVVARLRR